MREVVALHFNFVDETKDKIHIAMQLSIQMLKRSIQMLKRICIHK